jgi:hypothetical protein
MPIRIIDNAVYSGRVGIGTNNPTSPLHVVNTVGGWSAYINNDVGTGTQSGLLLDAGSSSSDFAMYVRNAAGSSDLFSIKGNGNVGIGTASPTNLLHIKGDDAKLLIQNETEGNYVAQLGHADSGGGGYLNLANDAGAAKVLLRSYGDSYFLGGNVGIGTTSPGEKLEVVGNIILTNSDSRLRGGTLAGRLVVSNSDTTSYITLNGSTRAGGANDIAFIANSTSVMLINSSGNVGIGTTSPNQKLHVDGNARVTGAYYDTSNSPGTTNQLLSSTATGTSWIDPSTIVAEAATLVVIACKNTSGATINKGTPVYQTGTVGATATIEIAPADALISANKLPAIGLLQTTLNANGIGKVVITGELTNFTTSPIDGVTPTTGDKVFVKSGGGLTLTKPTGEGNGIQNMGLVGKVSSGNAGSITVSSIMRTNDVPNLPTGRIWVGDGNTIVSDTVYVDEPNLRLGIGTDSPGAKLDVAGDVFINSNYTGSNAAANDLTIGKTTTGNHGLTIVTGPTYTGSIYFGDSGNNDAGIIKYQHSNNSMQFVTNRSEAMRIDTSGNVMIGNTNAGAKLDVRADTGYAFRTENASGNTFRIEALSGNIYTTGDLYIEDTNKIRLGASSDLQIYHDGSNSYINEVGTGVLSIQSDGTEVQINKGASEYIARFITDAGVKLYYDNSQKFETTSTGVTVTGAATAPTFLGDLNGTINTVTTAVTKANATNDTTVATTAFVQNLIGTIPAGLVFQGTWNAATNTPTLTSGAGTTGHFYIVSTSGSTNLDGVTDWVTGDWAVFIEQGGTDAWEKIDNSSVLDGAGTGNQITKWSGSGTSNTLTDSIITDNGTNVGIGTTSPGEKFAVKGDASYMEITHPTATSYSGIKFSEGGIPQGSIQNIGSTFATIARRGNFEIFHNAGGDLTLQHSGGNVGIGTTSPDNILHIRKGDTGYASQVGADTMLILETTNVSNSLQFSSTTSGNQYLMFGDDDPNAGWIAYAHSDNSLNFRTNGSEAMRIDSAGNVGIGTTSPAAKLDIGGTVSSLWMRHQNNEEVTTRFDNYGTTGTDAGSVFRMFNQTGATVVNIDSRSGSTRHTYFTGGGNVGIGTTSPAYKLDVNGEIRATTNIRASSNLLVGGYTDITGFINHRSNLRVLNKAVSDWLHWAVRDTSASEAVIDLQNIGSILTSGNVGIGTTSPSSSLQVAGGIQMADDTATASADKVGTMRYRTGTEYVEVDGVDLATGWDFTSGWNAFGGGTSVTNSTTFVSGSGQGIYAGLGLTTTKTYKVVIAGTQPSGGYISIKAGTTGTSFGNISEQSFDKVLYATLTTVSGSTNSFYIRLADHASNTSIVITKLEIQEVTAEDASYADMCMQTGASTYEWVNIVRNTY